LRYLQRLRIPRRLELLIEIAEILGHDWSDIGVKHRRCHAFVFAPLRRYVHGAGDKQVRSQIMEHLLYAQFVPRLLERPEKAHPDRLDLLFDQASNRVHNLGFVERHDDLTEAVNALRNAFDESLRHDWRWLPALRKMHDLADVARGNTARA